MRTPGRGGLGFSGAGGLVIGKSGALGATISGGIPGLEGSGTMDRGCDRRGR